MTYYTYPKNDSFPVRRRGICTVEEVIANELMTFNEVKARGLLPYLRFFRMVNVSCRKIYWMFGVRKAFESERQALHA